MLGLVNKQTLEFTKEIKEASAKEIKRIKKTVIKPCSNTNDYLEKLEHLK